MYVTDFACTYKKHSEEDQDIMYRAQYLQAFGLKAWDDKQVTKETVTLYNLCKQSQQMQKIFNTIRLSKYNSDILALIDVNNDQILFTFLFRFDLFDVAHRCFCDIINNKEISEKNYNILAATIK